MPVQDHVVMIIKYSVSGDVDREYSGELAPSLHQPVFAVGVVFAADGAAAAEPGAADAAGDAVVIVDFGRSLGVSGAGHQSHFRVVSARSSSANVLSCRRQ